MEIPKLLLTIVLPISTCGPLAAQTQAPPRTEPPTAEGKLANTQWRLASFSESVAFGIWLLRKRVEK